MNHTKLTMDDIKSLAPSVFTDHGAPEKTSERYVHIPTNNVITDMETLGWYVSDAKEIKARKRVGYQRHMIVFRNEDIFIKGEDGDDVYPQILLSNSHDGTGAFVFRAGLFRLVCSNGLVISTQDFSHMKIRHMGYSFEELKTLITSMVEKMPLVVESMNKFRERELTEDEQFKFAMDAIGLRFGENGKMEANIEELLKPDRKEDEGNDLWVVYNRIQERLVSGTFSYSGVRGKVRKARPIKNFQQDLELNEKLYALAECYV
jgi:hypothetical protein